MSIPWTLLGGLFSALLLLTLAAAPAAAAPGATVTGVAVATFKFKEAPNHRCRTPISVTIQQDGSPTYPGPRLHLLIGEGVCPPNDGSLSGPILWGIQNPEGCVGCQLAGSWQTGWSGAWTAFFGVDTKVTIGPYGNGCAIPFTYEQVDGDDLLLFTLQGRPRSATCWVPVPARRSVKAGRWGLRPRGKPATSCVARSTRP